MISTLNETYKYLEDESIYSDQAEDAYYKINSFLNRNISNILKYSVFDCEDCAHSYFSTTSVTCGKFQHKTSCRELIIRDMGESCICRSDTQCTYFRERYTDSYTYMYDMDMIHSSY